MRAFSRCGNTILPSNVTPSQWCLFQKIVAQSRIPLDKAQVKDVIGLMDAGLVEVVIVQTPWGVEFDLKARKSV
jgi:hypothetical protein